MTYTIYLEKSDNTVLKIAEPENTWQLRHATKTFERLIKKGTLEGTLKVLDRDGYKVSKRIWSSCKYYRNLKKPMKPAKRRNLKYY